MFGLILPLLALSAISYPKFYVIYSDATFDSTSIPAFEQLYQTYLNQFKSGCNALTGEERDFCLAYANAFLGVKATNSKDINSALSKVPSNNEFLLIVGDSFTTTINFAYLPKQMLVFLYGNSAIPPDSKSSKNIVEDIAEKFKQASAHRSKNVVFRLAKAFKSDKKSTKETLPVFPVYGNIKSRVSFLTVIGGELNIAATYLNCHSLFLSGGSKFSSSSSKCNTTFFIADEPSQKLVQSKSTVISEQYGVFMDDYDYTDERFLISYDSTKWHIYLYDTEKQNYQYYGISVPYSSHKAFNLITDAYNFDFYLQSETLVNPKQVNITVTDTITMAELPELLADPVVKISSSGNWDKIKNKPYEVITTDYKVQASSSFKLKYKTYPVFDYFSPSSAPLPYDPTPAPTQTPSPIDYPEFYVIYADSTFDSSSISSFEQLYKNYLNHYRDACNTLTGEERDFCLAYVNAFTGVKAVNSKDINTALAGVPTNNEFLLIVGDTLTTTIDFSKLKKQMLVFLYGNSAVPSQSAKNLVEDIADKFKQAKIDRKTKNAAYRIARAFKSGKKDPKATLPVFPVNGNVNKLVSFLTVIGGELKIVTNDLNCHSLFLSEGSKFSSGSLKCRTTFFIADETSQKLVQGTSLVLSEQYGVFYDAYDYSEERFLISYDSTRWNLYSYNAEKDSYTYENIYVPYNSYKAFNFITLAFNFDIHLNTQGLANPKPVNITVTDTINMAQLPELLADDTVHITSSGKWQTVTTKPIPVIHSDYPVEIDQYFQLNYKIYPIYDYFSPSVAPLPYQPTPRPTATAYKPTPPAFKYPTFYVIYADSTFDSSSSSAFEQLYTEYLKHFTEGCNVLKGEEKDFCLAYANAFLGVKAVNSKDINSALGKVPSNNEFLLIVGDTLSTTMNFAYLPKQMLVFLYGNSAVPSQSAKNLVEDIAEKFKQAKVDKTKNGVLRLAKAFKSNKKLDKKAKRPAVGDDDSLPVLPVFPIYGNIKSRVSFLTVIGGELNIASNELNCHTLFLSEGSRLSTNSKNCATTFFIADESSQPYVQGSKMITSEQYGIFFDYYDYEEDSFQISYKQDRWAIYSKDSSIPTYEYTGLYVPYSTYKAFNLITYAFKFNMHLDYNYLTTAKPVNITVTDTVNMAQLPELLANQKVVISSTGNWQTVAAKPVQVITTDFAVEKDPYYQLSYQTHAIFDYLSPSNPTFPYQPTPPPSATPYKPTPAPIDYPEFYVIYADTTFDSNSISAFEQLYKVYIDSFRDACGTLEGDEQEFCLAYVNAFLGVKAVNSKDINSALGKVPSKSEFLLIVGDTLNTTLNFAYLPKQMLVFLYGNSAVPNEEESVKNLAKDITEKFKQAKIDRTKNGVLRLAKAFKSGTKYEKKTGKRRPQIKASSEELAIFPIYGNIKSRVSFLTVIGAQLKIINSDLDCHTLFLSQGSRFATGSKNCKTNFFIADESSQIYVQYKDFVKCEQYGLFFDDYDYTEDSFQISYKKDRWAINIKDSYSADYEYSYVYVPYKDYKALNLITEAYNFDIHLDEDYLLDPRQINITVTDTITMAQLPELLADQQQKVKITSSGNWQTVTKKPIEVITTDYPVEIDPYYQPQFATYGIFDYLHPSSAPLPVISTPPPSYTNKDGGDDGGKKDGSKFGPGAIAGTAVGGAAVVGGAVTAGVCLGGKKDEDGGTTRSSELFDNMNP